MADFDLAIVGSGFAGSLLAMIARRLGRSVILLEKHSHPRMVIGESSTPLANMMLEELTVRYGLASLTPLAKWGSWQRSYPSVACGLKRGFSFFHHELNRPSPALADRERLLLVAASPHNEIADTHWYRPDFDEFLVREAEQLNVEYVDQVSLERVESSEDSVRLIGHRRGVALTVKARMVFDASGPRGFLHRALRLGESMLPGFPPTEALYNHFSGAGKLGDGDQAVYPYPIDDAAVHHIFDGGWIWVLRFNNGVTSAGVAARREFADYYDFTRGAAAWNGLVAQIPELEAQFSDARPIYDFKHLSQVAFRSSEIVGHRWALLPSAAGFVDPLLSTGFPLTLLGIGRLARAIEECWEGKSMPVALQQYSHETNQDLLATSDLVGALYANMDRFPLFARVTLLYFAAVSFAESARRLGKPHLAPSYLLRTHPSFGPQMRALLHRARAVQSSERAGFISADILDAIEQIDVAGLRRNARTNWFPIDAQDLLCSASKLEVSVDEITAMLQRSGFFTKPVRGPELATQACDE